MNPRMILIPTLLVAIPCLGFAGTLRPEPQAHVQSVALAHPVAALGDTERAELARATEAAPNLALQRGGQVSDHDLGIALLAVGIVLILLMI